MTREQVKQELKELKSLAILSKNGMILADTKGLKEKYDRAISKLEYIEQKIFVEVIYNNKSRVAVGLELHYSEDTIWKKWRKITDKLANMLEIKPTNFDKIKAMPVEKASHELTELFYKVAQYSNAEHYIKEWLQQEAIYHEI